MLLFEDKTNKIINACMNVHNELGNGFLEPIYQEALAIELQLQAIPFEKEKKINVMYKGHKLEKEYFLDFLCYGDIVVELKALSIINSAHKSQVINYLKATKYKVGLLVNFGTTALKWERLTLLK